MDDDEIFRLTADNRRLAAEMLAGLSPQQWEQPSLCAGWRVRDVAGHLLLPLQITFPRLLLEVIRRGSFDRASDVLSRRMAQWPIDKIVSTLRGRADRRVAPPGPGALGQLTDSCVHLRDAARPLGLATSPPLTTWRVVLDFLLSPRARMGFVERGRLDGLRFEATDGDWSQGTGALVRGGSEALAMAICGRPVAMAELTGDGVAVLRERLDGPLAPA